MYKNKSSGKMVKIADGAMNYGPTTSPVRDVANYNPDVKSSKKPGLNYSGQIGTPSVKGKPIC